MTKQNRIAAVWPSKDAQNCPQLSGEVMVVSGGGFGIGTGDEPTGIYNIPRAGTRVIDTQDSAPSPARPSYPRC